MEVSCSTEAWVATARLHQEHPERDGFRMQEIIDKAAELNLAGNIRPGLIVNITQQCVAGKNPNPAVLRLLVAVDGNKRRLYREGDPFHPLRAAGKVRPEPDEIPGKHRDLVAWYDEEYSTERATAE